MRIYDKHGSKERLLEMMSRVNKVSINEVATPEEMRVLEDAYEKLKRGGLNIRQGGERSTVLQNTEEGSFVEIGGKDSLNNEYLFNFKIEGDEMGQDDTFQIEDVEVIKFHFNTADNSMVVDLEGDDLKNFNDRYGANLYDTIEKYIDIDIRPQVQDIGERIYEEIAKKMASQPFGGYQQEFQDGMGYGDEKPVNSALRVKAPELEKFVYERSEAEVDTETLGGEELLKTKFHHLNADMEFHKLAQAYENLLKVKRIGFEPSGVLQRALSAARDLIAEYLQNAKGLNITGEDVQNFFHGMLTKFKSVVSEDDGKKMKDDPCWDDYEMVGMKKKDGKEVPNCVPKNEEEEELASVEIPSDQPEVPALDVDDVDDDGEELEGGLADEEPLPQFDSEQILKGIEVELEHTKDPKVALEIAMDHLMELPDYYTRLEAMEQQGEEELGDDPSIDAPEELQGHFHDLMDANKELEDTLLGFDTKTPNASAELNVDEYWRDDK